MARTTTAHAPERRARQLDGAAKSASRGARRGESKNHGSDDGSSKGVTSANVTSRGKAPPVPQRVRQSRRISRGTVSARGRKRRSAGRQTGTSSPRHQIPAAAITSTLRRDHIGVPGAVTARTPAFFSPSPERSSFAGGESASRQARQRRRQCGPIIQAAREDATGAAISQ